MSDSEASPEPTRSESPSSTSEPTAPEQPARRTPETRDPLRGSRTSGLWVAVVGSAVVLILLIVFIAQNTDPVDVRFLGWEGETPLAVALMIATVGGLVLAAVAGTLRIWQLRRRVRRERA